MSLNRRDFLKTGLSSLAYFTMASTVPLWISKSAQAITNDAAGDRILVIVQLAGGNDGLNTVIPYTDALYNGQDLRPNLHIVNGLGPTTLDSLNAFHPKLIRLTDWFNEGKVAVVQRVGYPNPDLSHFLATDFWELGTSPGSALETRQGWVSRYVDQQCADAPPGSIDALTMLAAGTFLVPLTLNGSTIYTPPAAADFDFYRIISPGGDFGDHILRFIEELSNTPTLDPNVDFLQRSANLTQASVDDIDTASQEPEINAYPGGSLGQGLNMVSKVVRAGFSTRVFYVSQGGYDTHANQFQGGDPVNLGDHPQLLDTFDQSIHAFLADMEASGNLDRVVLMTFSEFGRRVAENNSSGTDHGTASSLFVMGGQVKGGVYGGQPDLADLLSGNLRHHIDFRSVYGRILQDWLEVDPEPIFGTADFKDPVLNIEGGMEELGFLGGGSEGLLGDVNDDGEVNVQDLQLVINDALARETSPATDVNEDTITDAADVQVVINAILND